MTPTSRALIAAARAGLDPDAGAAARVRAKLDLALGAPAAASGPAASLAAPAVKTGLALKLAAVVLVAGAVAGIALPKHTARATAVPAPVVADGALVDPPRPHVVDVADVARTHAPVVTSADSPRLHVVATPAPPVHVVTPKPQAVASRSANAAPHEVSLAREVALIDRAMASLRAGHADDALTAIATYHEETADRGQLTEEAAAIAIEASCMLHRDVTDKLAAFDHTWPSSAQRSRLTTACHR